jgi:pilus assembly protein CpaF
MYPNEFINRIMTKIQDYLVGQEVPVPRWRGSSLDRSVQQPENRDRRESPEEMAFKSQILRAMEVLRLDVDERERQQVTEEVFKRIVGLGVLHPLLETDGIEEIIVRGGYVMTERDGQIRDDGYLAGTGKDGDDYFYRLSRRIAEMEGKGLGGKDPAIKVGLPDGSRFAATIPPLSREGTAINIRRFSKKKLFMEDLVKRGSANREIIDFLAAVSSSMKVSVVFAGKPGAGKTTWLNAFSAHLPSHCQVTVVETFAELRPQVEHFHHLVVDEASGSMADAINNSVLRMRPDVLMIGEVVSQEAYQYILALNLGIVSHTTTHAQSATLALARLENLAQREMNIQELREVIGHGLGLVVHLSKDYDADRRQYVRAMSEIIAVRGTKEGRYVTKVLTKRTGYGEFSPLEGGMELFR